MRHHHRTFLAAAVAILALPLMGTQCTARSICDKSLQCQEEKNDRSFSDDAAGVCAVEYETRINALYANEEEDCHRLADAILALDNCRVGLTCDDFVEQDPGGECEAQDDALDDALGDVRGVECSAQE